MPALPGGQTSVDTKHRFSYMLAARTTEMASAGLSL
jgi:hypothetical protein